MSRTDAHTRFKHTDEGRAYNAYYDRVSAGLDYHAYRTYMNAGPQWQHEWSKQFGRPRAVQEYARQMNRNERHAARAALHGGDYDTLSTRYSGRHGGVWLAW